MKRDKWVWMPHAGHFIGGDYCHFRLSTYVGKYIVSTVGELFWGDQVNRIKAEVYDKEWYAENKSKLGDDFTRAYMKKFGYNEIGCGRKYETMVFKAKKSDKCGACPYIMLKATEIDFEGYNEAEEAFKGHYAMCNKWSKQ